MTVIAGSIARGGELREGWLELDGERILDTGDGASPRAPDVAHDGIVSAGLYDLQVNGAAGWEVTGGERALDAIEATLLEHGITSYLATVVTCEPELLHAAMPELEQRTADPDSPLTGVHLEGPFLNPEHGGIHPRTLLREPDAGIPSAYDSPAVRLVTLAPELRGAAELTERLRSRGVRVSLGHSGASAAVAGDAIDRGATLVTHVFNAMSPLHHRRPGLIGVALTDPRVQVGVIADALHLDPMVLRLVRAAAGDRVILVSDSSPAAAAAPGRYRMAGGEIVLGSDGRVLTAAGRLAGTALTLDEAVRRWTHLTGAPLSEALSAASERPARAMGAPVLRPGASADLVLLSPDGVVQQVMRRGRWLPPHRRGRWL